MPDQRRPLRTVVRRVVLTVNTPMARVRLRRAVARAPRPIALEVGGLRRRPGWLVVNVNALARNYLDATRPWPFEDGALSYVFADNMIEHVPLDAGRSFLAEAHRCLRPGGVIRLLTPDVRYHVDLYLKGGSSVVDGDLARLYRSVGALVEHPVDILRTPIADFGHYRGYVYDFEALDTELQRAGFQPAVRKPLGESDHPPLVGLDDRVVDGPAQLVVEATR